MINGTFGETDSGLMVFHAAVMATENLGGESGIPHRRTILEVGKVLRAEELEALSGQRYYAEREGVRVAVSERHTFGYDEFGTGRPSQYPHAPSREDGGCMMTIMGAVVKSDESDNQFGQHAVTMRTSGRGWMDAIYDGRQDLTLIGTESLLKYEASLQRLALDGRHPLRAVVAEALQSIKPARLSK